MIPLDVPDLLTTLGLGDADAGHCVVNEHFLFFLFLSSLFILDIHGLAILLVFTSDPALGLYIQSHWSL